MKYKFRYRKGIFWKTKTVTGHRYEASTNKMCLYFEDGGLEEIAHWTDYAVRLGQDWVIVAKKAMEDKAGVAIPIRQVK